MSIVVQSPDYIREVYSDLAIPPGETLADEIAARGMSQTELAARLGRPVQVVNEIIRAKKAITDDTALGLEKVLGIPATFWVNLEQNYRMTKPSSAKGIDVQGFAERSLSHRPSLTQRNVVRGPPA